MIYKYFINKKILIYSLVKRLPVTTEEVPHMIRIEIVERFPNIWSGRGSYNAHNCTKHIRPSRICSELDERGGCSSNVLIPKFLK